MMKYNRVLLKLSGEALMGDNDFGIDPNRIAEYAEEIKGVSEKGVQVGIVIGGGNIFRGISGASQGMDRVQADHMGMLATVINGLALQGALESAGVKTRLQSAMRWIKWLSHLFAPSNTSFRERSCGNLFRGNRKPILYNGYRCYITRCRNSSRCHLERN